MQSDEIRSRFLKFFEKRGHKIIPSASLVPDNDPSVLFTTAGMHPLISYLLGDAHPMGNRLASVQKCVRTQDIDEVGDKTHDTFFEMLGNWSLGDYFKKDAITWSYEFLTSKEEGLGLDINRLYFTCFKGDENAPKDTESAEVWRSLGVSEDRIYFLGAGDNWWSPGENGPCGPDSEMFYDLTGELGDMTQEEFLNECDEQKVVEIWNDVFMEYEKKDGKIIGKLKKQNVDTGAGLERISMVMQETDNVFDTDLFKPIMDKINEFTESKDERAKRIVADHIRTAVFILSDGVTPNNVGRGYILRRLLRRSVRFADSLGFKNNNALVEIAKVVVDKYKEKYLNVGQKASHIQNEVNMEEEKFRKTLAHGLKEFEKGIDPFILFTTYGFPIELTTELAREKGQTIDLEDFNKQMKAHVMLSQTSSAGMFKGGLADASINTTKLHTATHLLNAALRIVLGAHVVQRGSNITAERLRFDFTHPQKMTEEEKKRVEEIVNDKIAEKLPVTFMEIPKAEAEKIATHSFNEKYSDVVKVYSIGDEQSGYFSREFCGGPHVKNTSELGVFKIQKEEAVGEGIRRIKAVLL